jgi:PAS domain S-box-containing protein
MNDHDKSKEQLLAELAELRQRNCGMEIQSTRNERVAAALAVRTATQALEESEASLQFVLEGSRLGTWDWNIETGEVKRNDYWAEMLGYTSAEVDDATAGSWLNLLHPDDRQRAWQSIEDNLAGHTLVHEVEYRMLARDGSYRWILDRARIVRRDVDGRATRMSGTHQDVTERRQMEDDLRAARDALEQRVAERTEELTRTNELLQSEVRQRQTAEESLRNEHTRLTDIIEADQAGTWEWNVQTGETIFNERWAEIVGYRLAEVSPTSIETWTRLVHPDDLPDCLAMQERHFRGELDYYDIEARVKHKCGKWVWIRDRGKVITRNEQGQPLWMRGTYHDIDKQKNAEAALRESEARFRAYVDQAADALFVQDYSGRFLDVNPQACASLGYNREELLQMSFFDVEAEFDLVKERESSPPITPATPRTLAGRQRRKDGSTFPVEARVSCIDLEGQRHYLCLVRDITDRKQAELELLCLNERLELAKQAAGQGIWDWNVLTGELSWSPEIYSMFGIDAEAQAPSLAAWEASLHPEDREFAVEKVRQSLRDGTLFDIEYRVVHPDGKVRWLGGIGRAFYDDTGQAIRMTGINMDVTERREMLHKTQQWNAELERTVEIRTAELNAARTEAERALAQTALSEARFRAMFEQAPLGVALVDSQTGRIYEVNPRFAEIAGRTREELVTTDWMSITHPEDIEPDLNNMARLNAGEIPGFQMNKRLVRPDDSIVWINLTIAPVTVRAGQGPGRLSMIEDITFRKKAEEQLNDTLQRLQLSNTAGSIGSWTLNLRNNSLEWDDRLCEWFGIPLADRHSELFFEFWRCCVHPDDLATAEAALSDSIRSGAGAEVKFRVNKLGDRMRYIDATWVVERDASGTPARLLGINRDMTAQHDIEEELLAAKQAADAANEAKSSFLATMSHEIRTPMNGVIGMTGLLLDTDLTPQQRRCAETIRTSGDALLTLINDILDFSKIEAGKLELETLDFDLRTILDEVTEPLALRAHDKGIKLVCVTSPDVPSRLLGDPGRLRQILTNLVGNAVKFTEQGDVSVQASVAADTEANAVIRFVIRDTGIGLTPEQQRNLFQKFTQADTSMTRRFGGTGLGLAISKKLTELMGGEIGVTSQAGTGAEFWFTVCLGKRTSLPASDEVSATLSPSRVATTAVYRQGARILVAEDNIVNQEVALGILRKLGLQASAVENGENAIETLQREHYDLVLMDVEMPEIDGLEATRRIRDPQSAVHNHQIPIIAMTAAAMQGDRERCLEAGMNGYVTKPVSPRSLVEALNTWLPPENSPS